MFSVRLHEASVITQAAATRVGVAVLALLALWLAVAWAVAIP